MGATCAPSYANLFLGAWEQDIFQCNPPRYIDKIRHWIRYIDDIWFIWEGSMDELKCLMDDLNNNDLNIKLTYTHGHLNFLDVEIQVTAAGILNTDVYRKPTATNTLLHAQSSHLQSTIRGIPIGQHLRIKRICSTEENFQKQARELYSRFRERGYSHRTIRHGYHRARGASRNALLYKPPIQQSGEPQQVKQQCLERPPNPGERNVTVQDLPPELVQHIISFLSVRDVMLLGETCHFLHQVCNSWRSWRSLYQKIRPCETEAADWRRQVILHYTKGMFFHHFSSRQRLCGRIVSPISPCGFQRFLAMVDKLFVLYYTGALYHLHRHQWTLPAALAAVPGRKRFHI
ncbi:unnamed protein product [Ranitomeya imitator]|uniref:F-box domain-containing protein n=1 Tax=Ranitomeya imitator TaxID=111125 RepID=A0ABN9M7G0_9NEOB|nr:unnamed protein product [Ranitomeya imitator]